MTLSPADRLDILDVITRADEAASRRDADGYAELFTEDAVLDGTQGRHAGRQALRAGVGPIWAAEGPGTLHLTLNPVVESGPSGDQATVRSVLLIIDPAAPPAIRAARRSPRNSAGPKAPGASPGAPSRRQLDERSAHLRDRPSLRRHLGGVVVPGVKHGFINNNSAPTVVNGDFPLSMWKR